MMNLSTMDIKFLAEQPSAQARSVLASKLAKDYRQGAFTVDTEIALANDIFRMLVKDTEKMVRQALADELAYCNDVPHEVIVALAKDESSIAIPVLKFSPVLTEEDLVEVVNSTQEVARWIAVAQRMQVTENVADCLMKTGHNVVMKEVMGNQGATLSEALLSSCWDTMSRDKSMLEIMVQRGNLPLSIAEKLFFAVSEELKRKLVTEYKFSTPSVRKAVNNVREWQMLGILPPQNDLDPRDDAHIDELINDLHDSGRLSYSLLMRALCTGNVQMFEAGIAKLAGVPRVNARILLMDHGPLGFEAIYKAAQMPEGFKNALETLLRISFEETEYGRVRRDDFRKRIVERIYQHQYHHTVENMDYVLSIIGGRIAASASVH
jgi:uncharacterized protein (DUF2336 family)